MLSIDISHSYISIAEGEQRGEAVVVERFARIATPEGTVKNGILTGGQELAAALADCVKRGRFSSKKAALTINSSAVITREITVPFVKKEKELRGLLRNEVEQASQAKQESIIDYVILGRNRTETEDTCSAMCFVIPKLIVESYRDLLERQAGLVPYALDVLPHVVYKLAKCDKRITNAGTVVLADVNRQELRLNLVEASGRMFSMTQPVSQTKDVMGSEYILSSIGAANMVSDQSMMEHVATVAAENISKLIQFQMMKNKENPVQEVLLYGELADDAAVTARMAEQLGRPVRLFTRPSFLRCPEDMAFHHFTGAVGGLISL